MTYPERGFAELYRACRESGWFTTLQVESEIVRFLELIHERKMQTAMEIGTAAGGTLYLLTRAMDRHATILTLDLEGDPLKAECLRGFARLQQRVGVMQGNSNDPATAQRVRAELAGRPLDLLLIDGDHSSYGVRKDFELYRPLVAPGGIVAFHDVCLAGGVREFWQEVKREYGHDEFIGDSGQHECGLGLLHV